MHSKTLIKVRFAVLLILFSIVQLSCQRAGLNSESLKINSHSEKVEDDLEFEEQTQNRARCMSASVEEISYVNFGYSKLEQFLNYCRTETNNSGWCDQVARPNPDSHNTFDCTYNHNQPHNLIHPEAATWPYAIEAIRIVKELEIKQIKVCTIYNWWRPEPYNTNVGGAPERHPFGTSVDVRFCSKNDQSLAHKQLCKMRKAGRIRALGYYSSTALHIGVGDKVANTWGKSCP